MTRQRRVLIMGAGGRDFHVFNTCYRDDAAHVVVAFTAAQIPHIDRRRYPPVLSGPRYPDGIPILPEADLESIIEVHDVTDVVFAYSDVHFDHIEAIERRVTGCGATFVPFDPDACLVRGAKPCVAVCAVRTGCGKSPLSRFLAREIRALGLRVSVVRHPMPYGNLREQVVQRFETLADLERHHCTIEEMEEYEPHVLAGDVVFAGADYERVLEAAEAEADVVLWDGGNNDAPFVDPNLLITVLDPLRPGDELSYFPGTWNLERADVLVIAKSNQAEPEALALVRRHIQERNPTARVLMGRSPIHVDDSEALRGRRVLVVEDGPTVTHGGMGSGAGFLAAARAGAEIVDPRPYVSGEIAEAFETYPHLRQVLPALGYAQAQLDDLEHSIAAVDCDLVVIGTPIDLTRIVPIEKPTLRVTYAFDEVEPGRLADILREHLIQETSC